MTKDPRSSLLARYNYRTDTSRVKQGGLSNELYYHPAVQQYLKRGAVFGYIGSGQRTVTSDRELEKVLRAKGVSTAAIAGFIVSNDGRHYADQLPTGPGSTHGQRLIRDAVHRYLPTYYANRPHNRYFTEVPAYEDIAADLERDL